MTDVGPLPRRRAPEAAVTEEDIRAARTAWWDAREGGDPEEHVAMLWAHLVRLLRAEARQHAHARPVRRAVDRVDVPRQRGRSLLG